MTPREIEKLFERRNIAEIVRRNKQVLSILEDAAKEIADRIRRYHIRHPKGGASFYAFNKQIERNIDAALKVLAGDLEKSIRNGVTANWELANTKNNAFVKAFAAGSKVPGKIMHSMNLLNLDALSAFLDRKDFGLSLSDKVWKFTRNYKEQLEQLLATGITEGENAFNIAKKVEKYIAGKPIKYAGGLLPKRNIAYQAVRLAATETNMAYRMSDYERRQKLPFVIGVEVVLSAAHPTFDICDSMAGNYPKGFVFLGWHPRCICYTKVILQSKSEFIDFIKTGHVDQRRYVRSIPQSAQAYLQRHRPTISKWKTKPFFLRDNFTEKFELRKDVLKIGRAS